jgi:acetyl-CoA C-acetyltransferase
MSRHLVMHGLTDAPSQYALFENVRRVRLGLTREQYAEAMGALFAPFTNVAVANPHAAVPVGRDARELVAVTEKNRMIADPYPRDIVARDKVNQGAAVLLMSVATARELGVPEEKWVYLHGHADLRERALMEREDLSRSPASITAVEHALEVAGVAVDQLATLDPYSCFSIPVFNICDGLGIDPADPRGLTLTGGLPFFGGAGNNYSMHAVAETVQRLRANPGTYGLVGANGGLMSKYSAAVYSTLSTEWRADRSAEFQAELDAAPGPEEACEADGWTVIETWTVKYDRRGGLTGIVIGRLEADGRRFIAQAAEGDKDLMDLLTPVTQPETASSSVPSATATGPP